MNSGKFSLTTAPTDKRRLEVRTEWVSDRWTHEVHLVDSERSQRILLSIEGNCEEDWPPSPPIQDLDLHELAAGQTALLGVGMAGQGHWSASISQREQQLEFDMACLVRAGHGWLGSTYQILPDHSGEITPNLLRRESDGLTLHVDRATLRIRTADGKRKCQLNGTGSHLKCEPIEASTDPNVSTQWAYHIQFLD